MESVCNGLQYFYALFNYFRADAIAGKYGNFLFHGIRYNLSVKRTEERLRRLREVEKV